MNQEMTQNQETQLALHEQRISAIELYHTKIDAKLDKLLERLDNQYVLQKNYEKDLKQINEQDTQINEKLAIIEQEMVTKEQMKQYQRSQLWQRFMTFLGGVGTAALTWLIIYELQKVLTK